MRPSPHLALRRAAQHLGDAAPGAAGRSGGSARWRRSPARRISALGGGPVPATSRAPRRGRCGRRGSGEVGVDAEQLRRAGERHAGFLVELARERRAPPSRPSRRRRRGNASPADSRAAPAARAACRRAPRLRAHGQTALEAPVALQSLDQKGICVAPSSPRRSLRRDAAVFRPAGAIWQARTKPLLQARTRMTTMPRSPLPT